MWKFWVLGQKWSKFWFQGKKKWSKFVTILVLRSKVVKILVFQVKIRFFKSKCCGNYFNFDRKLPWWYHINYALIKINNGSNSLSQIWLAILIMTLYQPAGLDYWLSSAENSNFQLKFQDLKKSKRPIHYNFNHFGCCTHFHVESNKKKARMPLHLIKTWENSSSDGKLF